MQLVERIFRAHPRKVGEGYLEHMAFAARFAGRMLAAGAAALVHALVPCLFETTASRMVRAIVAELDSRRRGVAERPQAEVFGGQTSVS
jgi:uncharacterized protein DUF6356